MHLCSIAIIVVSWIRFHGRWGGPKEEVHVAQNLSLLQYISRSRSKGSLLSIITENENSRSIVENEVITILIFHLSFRIRTSRSIRKQTKFSFFKLL